jgi:hypothetical protein
MTVNNIELECQFSINKHYFSAIKNETSFKAAKILVRTHVGAVETYLATHKLRP